MVEVGSWALAVMKGIVGGGVAISVLSIVRAMRGGFDPQLPHSEVAYAVVRNAVVLLGVFGFFVWVGDVPLLFLGIGRHPPSFLPVALVAGVGLGLGTFLACLGLALVSSELGLEHDYRWPGQLLPRTQREWTLFLGAVSPIFVVVEEVVYRGILVGVLFPFAAMAVPFPHAAVVVVSSVLFGLAHANQGEVGVLTTGFMGLVLGTAFVLADSLLLVVVAHYVANVGACVFNDRYSEVVRRPGAERSQPLEGS